MFETDALRATPAPFHGLQHNQQGPSAVGAAMALSKVMEKNKLPGSVWVIETPAEEIPAPQQGRHGKSGVFDNVDFVFKSHGTPQNSSVSKAGLGIAVYLIEAVLYDFKGLTSHAAFGPWQGRDSARRGPLVLLTASTCCADTRARVSVHGTITKVGGAANVFNDSVQVDHWVRMQIPPVKMR